MKKLLTVVLSIMLVAGAFTYVFATDGGMDDPRPMGGMMGGQKGQGSMMMHGDMMSGMGLQMKHTTDLMQRMSGVMHKEMDSSDMREMSKIMMDMSSHIKYMSEIMSRGNASQKEMQDINDHVKEMEKRFNMMKVR
jgi:Spy/CpxP family protein refolding chaperone